MAAVLIALGAVIVGATIFPTATRYRELPDRVSALKRSVR